MSPELRYLHPEIDSAQLAACVAAYSIWKTLAYELRTRYTVASYTREREAYSNLLTFPRHVTAEAIRLANQD